MDCFAVILALIASPILVSAENEVLRLDDRFPDFEAETTNGTIKFYDWLESDKWAILFSHPADFMPVSTTELHIANTVFHLFKAKNVSLIALSCDPIEYHEIWIKDILSNSTRKEEKEGKEEKLNFPIIADPSRDLAVRLGMLTADEKDLKGLPLKCRVVFVVGPGHKLKLSMLYPTTTGINFVELLRVIDSLQLTAFKEVATPANWQEGGDCLVLPSVSKDEADVLFPQHEVKALPSGKQYMRTTPQPRK